MATDENSRESEIDLYTKGTEVQSAINKTFSKAIFRNSFLFEYKYFPQKKRLEITLVVVFLAFFDLICNKQGLIMTAATNKISIFMNKSNIK